MDTFALAPSLPPYVGRFAPSPSGPLHFGSLVAAMGSYLEARRHGGRWLLRIEDIDRPRTVPGAAEGIIATLARFGFEWDGGIVWQSRRDEAYHLALDQLKAAGHAFPCACTRREMADSALARDGSRRYPGTCRNGLLPGRGARAWRIRAEGMIGFDDAIQGWQQEDLALDAGDYVVLRADGLFAYQLAVVVDDAEAGVTHVVRGADLLDSTARQIHLQGLLGMPHPAYAHLPVATNAAGEKLSKQTLARAIDEHPPAAALCAALRFLGQIPPAALDRAPLAEIWHWAIQHWRLDLVPRQRHAPATTTDSPRTASCIPMTSPPTAAPSATCSVPPAESQS
ncbi:tRNA glutamyl-Q(34) synthetase GluQRS [Thauera sp.]|uniref:tRNA glutamyl-Q(34) synthetase GluQRS n=1 Tax=Thauera sp. TaxID=1905334 RepID=UPI0039E38468